MRKAVCAILCILLCFSFCCCKSENGKANEDAVNQGDTSLKNEEINLLYFAGDSFNPYSASTKHNRELSHLLYDPLIKCDNSFNPTYCLAQNALLDGKVCTVTLKSAYFTDGTPVTADDVVYSYNTAKKSETIYGSYFYEVASVSGNGNTVIFNLNCFDPYFLNLLDFPVIKAGSDGQKNSDGVEIAPIGCGRYYVGEDSSILLRNGNYHGKIGEVGKINLINAPDDISATHYVEVGATEMYYADESVANIARMSGKRADVNTNNFVYIGINGAYGPLTSNLLRYAISAAIDRTEICHSAYFDNATPASGFFNPSISETSAVQSLKTVADTQITVENLNQIGYNNLDNGYYCNDSGKHIGLTLLVNSDNYSRVTAAKLIAKQCKTAGIEINVIERPYAEYASLLSSGNFQLYLGEIRVLPNFDLSGLVVAGGSAAYGLAPASVDVSTGQTLNAVCADMINKYKNGECLLSDLAGSFITEMPQIPVCYRNGMLFYTSRIESKVKPSASDIFFSFENYNIK